METVLQDLRYGARLLLKKFAFTSIAILTLALGIGANTAIFSVVNAVLLRPLPYPESDRIVALGPEWPDGDFQGVSEAKFNFWRAHSQSFAGMAATTGVGSGLNLTGGNEPEFITGVRVSVDFFRVLGVEPALGRRFTAEEDSPAGARVLILSYNLWQQRFGADPSIAGKNAALNGNNYLIVGVMPSGFEYGAADIILPTRINPASREEGHNYTVLGRLKPGVSLSQSQTEMRAVFQQFKEAEPKMIWRGEQGIRVSPYLASLTGSVRAQLLILLGAVSLVLLIACANVANLQLTRAASRRKEMAVRAALGAGGWRIVRQLLTEGVLLALVGGLAGVLLAAWGVEMLAALLPEGLIPRTKEIGFDGRVLVFALATAVGTGLLFALAPAIRATRLDVNQALKESGGKGAGGGERGRLGNILVIAEVALALVLLIGATLLLRTFAKLQQIDPGFNPHQVLTFEVAPNGAQYDTTAKQADYFRRALEKIGSLPGVEAAAVTSNLPLGAWLNLGVGQPGNPDSMRSTEVRLITADYFKVMKMSVRRGRAFSEADAGGATPVIIVNEAYVRRIFPNAEPIGQTLAVGGKTNYQIVGVVNDVKQFGLSTSAPATVFMPIAQVEDQVMRRARQYVTMKFAIRTSGDPLSLSAAVRQEMTRVDSSLPLARMRSLEQIVERSLAADRFNTVLLGLFALIGLALATVGIYGVLSYTTEQRTHEIGLRLALGAQTRDVIWLVIRQGLGLAGLGVAIGIAATFALGRMLTSFSGLLYGVTVTDPATFSLISALLLMVALVACYLPARRATRVDPLVALRCD